MKTKWIKYNNTIFMKKWNITLFPFIFLRGKNKEDVINRIGVKKYNRLVNHEMIHRKQQKGLFMFGVLLAAIIAITTNSFILTVLGHFIYYVIYILNWVINLFRYGNKAYVNIAMEKEASMNNNDYEYIKKMKYFSWIRYLLK